MTCARLVLAAMLAMTILAPALCAQETRPINAALIDPAQIFPSRMAIHGFRLNVIYGNNVELQGLDVGIANWITGNTTGVQWGLINRTGGDFKGWQGGPVSTVGGKMTGLQTSMFVSVTKH